MRSALVTTLAAAAVLAAPALAQNDTAGNAAGQDRDRRQTTQAGQDCIDRLQEIDVRLTGFGYGRVGPAGYGNYGGVYRGAAPMAEGLADDAPMTGLVGGLGTPRADMRTLMRAGYLLATTGHDQACRQVADAAEEMGERYRQALETGEYDEELAAWRGDYLASAVSVTKLEQPLRLEEILDADLRNLRDEDLGDVEDVVTGPQGEIRYVLVSTGGFLGIGDEQVPVRWQDLKVTPSPYRDTLVLDVSEQTFENAPRIQAADGMSLVGEGDADEQFQSYWEKAGLGDDAG